MLYILVYNAQFFWCQIYNTIFFKSFSGIQRECYSSLTKVYDYQFASRYREINTYDCAFFMCRVVDNKLLIISFSIGLLP